MTEEYGHLPDGFLLNSEEVEELRKNKQELTQYAKEKLRKLIEKSSSEVNVFKNFLEKSECQEWIDRAPKFTGSYDFEDRVLDISNHHIVTRVKNFLENACNCKLNCSSAQIQLWPVNSSSELHIHKDLGREDGDYNSLLYLNDDFDGGEFITKDLSIKPETGMLTFFDGSHIYHGVREVKYKHRYSLIFWWNNTRLKNSTN
jgi:hypothetical protein